MLGHTEVSAQQLATTNKSAWRALIHLPTHKPSLLERFCGACCMAYTTADLLSKHRAARECDLYQATPSMGKVRDAVLKRFAKELVDHAMGTRDQEPREREERAQPHPQGQGKRQKRSHPTPTAP